MSVLVRLLGPVDVTVEGSVRPVPGLRRKAVLARLALRPGEVVSVDQLIGAVWDGNPPATAVNSLQSHVSYLRRVLGTPDAIRARAPGYVLGAPATDLRRAEGLIGQGRGTADPVESLAVLEQALALWRGQPLADVAKLSWFAQEAARLEHIRRAAEQAAVECRLALGQHAALVPELAKLSELHPFDEDQHGQLMVALYRCGRQAEALTVFQRLRERLREDLGIDPGGPVRDLQAAILRQDPGLDLTPVPARPGRPTSGAVSLIERAEETALIEAALDHTLNSRTGRVLIFEGVAGIGKTSLLDHARERASILGFTVASARGTDLETDYGWGCARQLFHRYTEAENAISPFPSSDQAAPGGEYRTITSLFWLASDLASRNPLVIVFDDLHWADTPSVQFLAFLAARLDELQAVVVLGLRPGHERIGRFTSSIAGLPYTISRVLQSLSAQGCAQLLADVIEAAPDQELADQCQALSRGNPFLLKELALHLSAVFGDVGRTLPEGSPSVHRFVSRQLGYLQPVSVEMAQALAVLGDGAGSDWLAKVTEASPREALDALVPLVASQLVVAEGIPVRFSFGHPLIRDSVYDSIPPVLRTELHLRTARAAMGTHDPMKAASHLLRVPPGFGEGDPVPVLSEAAELSLARGSVNSAVSFLRRILEEDLGNRRTEMLTRLGTTEALVDCGPAIEHLSEALAREPDPERRGQIACGLAGTLWAASRPRDAARVCQESLERDGGITDDTRQFLQGCIAMVAYGARYGSDLVTLVDSYRNETTGTSVGGLVLEAGLALHDMHQNRRKEAQRRALNVLAGDRLIGHPVAEIPVTVAWYALAPCDSPALLPSVETALEHSRRAGSMRGLAPSLHYRSEVMYAQGYLADALSDARRAWEAAEYGTIGLGQTFIADVLLKTLVARGEIDQAGEVLRQIKARHVSSVTPTLFAPGEIALYLAMGDIRRAFATALATRDECAASPWVNPLVRDWRAPLVRCYSLLGRDEEARAAADDLLSLSTEWGTPRAVGRALRYAATVESGARELELLEESVRLLEATPANLERAKSLYAFGEALIRSGRPADARSRLGAALDLAAFCGARPLQDTISSAIRRAGGGPLLPVVMAALSPTETHVADLSGAGMSAREIAEELQLTLGAVRQRLAAVEQKRASAAVPSLSL